MLVRIATVLVLVPSFLVDPAAGQEDGIHASHVAPFIERWCADCHAAPKPKGGLDLENLKPDPRDDTVVKAVRSIRDHLRGGTMPPAKADRPPRADVLKVIAWTGSFLTAADAAVEPDAGRVTVRRLSRYEYENTVRDLFGFVPDATKNFPADDLGYGFDNIGDAMTTSLLHVEKYAAAAEEITRRAISLEDPDDPTARRLQAEFMKVSRQRAVNLSADFANLFSRATLTGNVELPRTGEYVFRVRAYADQAGDEVARMALVLDGRTVHVLDVPQTRDEPAIHEWRTRLAGGRHEVGFSFVNDYYNPEAKDRSRRDRNLHVDWLEITGPVDPVPPSAAERWILGRDRGRGKPLARATRILKPVMTRLWRRPVRTAEVRRVAKLVATTVESGATFKEALQVGLQAVLVSPHFLFRLEPGGKGRSGRDQDLDPWVLASRLSYFIWSSAPDERLLDLARSKKLTQSDVLEAETRRMLADERSAALGENFAAQWLELRNLEDVQPDPERFDGFDADLARALRRETEALFLAVLREKRPATELLTADFTFLNEDLARHYGIDGVLGDRLRRVPLQDPRRRGVLAHGSVLTVTSNPTRTSPVKRGKWILENVLDAPPPPPPPGADSFGEGEVNTAATLREKMAHHRRDAGCATCHLRMDALGLALENFDAVGRWRDRDQGGPIDASGELPDGRRIRGVVDLRSLLAGDRAFLRCILRKLFIYAVGRDLSRYDEKVLEELVGGLPAETSLEDLVVATVRLDAFRKRRVTP